MDYNSYRLRRRPQVSYANASYVSIYSANP